MGNNHKQESVNIYAKEFKDKLKNLVAKELFDREILFNGAKSSYEYLSIEEQQKISRRFKTFVSENILSLQNDEVEFILNSEESNKPYSWEDVENLQQYYLDEVVTDLEFEINNSDLSNKETERLKKLLKVCEDMDDYENFATDNWISCHREDYEYQPEIYQWFLVTSFLANKLYNYDQTVILNYNYWGRQSCGQSIELDNVIQDIFLNWWCE